MRISDWSSDVCSSDLSRRRCSRSDNGFCRSARRNSGKHPHSAQHGLGYDPIYRQWHHLRSVGRTVTDDPCGCHRNSPPYGTSWTLVVSSVCIRTHSWARRAPVHMGLDFVPADSGQERLLPFASLLDYPLVHVLCRTACPHYVVCRFSP